MTEEDKNIHFLISKIRELEKSIITYNGTDIRYVDDKTLQNCLDEEKTKLQCHNTRELNFYIYNELLTRERAGIKIIKA